MSGNEDVAAKRQEESSFGWGIHGEYVYENGDPYPPPDTKGITGLRIDRADPWSVLSADEIRVLHEHPGYDVAAVIRCAGDGCPAGDILTVSGVNRRVVYRLTEPLEGADAWVMKWPD